MAADQIKKTAFFLSHPELKDFADKLFASPDELTLAAKAKGISLPANAWEFFQQETAPSETMTPEEITENVLKKEESHSTHFEHNGRQKTQKSGKSYIHILENTVRDWNTLHKDNPSLQIKGGVFKIDTEGNKILNPEVVQKIPLIHEHANEVFSAAFGKRALADYQRSLQLAHYKDPFQDPVIQQLQSTITRRTEVRLAERENELKNLNGTNAIISPEERENIERETRLETIKAASPQHLSTLQYYARRRFRRKIPWIHDAIQEYETYQTDRAHSQRNLYKDIPQLNAYISTRVQTAINNEIESQQEIDRKRGVVHDRTYYENRLDRRTIEKQIRQEEANAFKQNTQGISGISARRTLAGKELLEEQRAFEKLTDELEKTRKKQKEIERKETERLNKLRNPNNDSRITALRNRVQDEIERVQQHAITNRQTLGLIQTSAGSWGATTSPPKGREDEIAGKIMPGDLPELKRELLQQEYEKLFTQLSPDQLERYARKDVEINEAFQRQAEKKRLEEARRKEALKISRKRGLLRQMIHRLRPFKRNFLFLPGQLQPDEKVQKERIHRKSGVFARISRSLDPLRNHYDNARDWIDKQYEYYRPSSIAKRSAKKAVRYLRAHSEKLDKILQRAESFKKRRSTINSRYNPYEIAKRNLAELRTALKDYAKQAIKSTAQLGLRGAKATGKAGVHATASLTKAGAKAGSQFASRLAAQAATRTGFMLVAGNPLIVGGIIILVPLLFIIISPFGGSSVSAEDLKITITCTDGTTVDSEDECSVEPAPSTTTLAPTHSSFLSSQAGKILTSIIEPFVNKIAPKAQAQISCPGFTSSIKSADSMYNITVFGCTNAVGNINPYTDPTDNCNPAHAPTECSEVGSEKGACEKKIIWYAANTDIFGVNKKIKLTNPKNGKSVVVMTIDQGPSCTQEKQHGPIIDASYPAAVSIGTSGNYEQVKVEPVSDTTPLGPSDGTGNTDTSSSSTLAPNGDVIHKIHISYGKPSKDIIVTYPVPDEVYLSTTNPPPTESPFRLDQDITFVRWSLKKLNNPGKTPSELNALTLPPVDTTLVVTLRPKPGVTDTYIVSQAIVTLDPISTSANSNTDTSGAVDTGNPNSNPNTNTCGGKISINNPDGTNFGDPECNFTIDGLAALLKKEDPENAEYWFSIVVPCESPGYDPNLYYRTGAAGDTPDEAGAWGLFQMGRGLNGQYDHGDVAWPKQVTNAITYRRNVSWRYWACAKDRW